MQNTSFGKAIITNQGFNICPKSPKPFSLTLINAGHWHNKSLRYFFQTIQNLIIKNLLKMLIFYPLFQKCKNIFAYLDISPQHDRISRQILTPANIAYNQLLSFVTITHFKSFSKTKIHFRILLKNQGKIKMIFQFTLEKYLTF